MAGVAEHRAWYRKALSLDRLHVYVRIGAGDTSRSSATLCFSMIAAMLLALTWMVLMARVAAIEQAEAALLLRPQSSRH